jgi:hypothetical protein
MPGRLARFLFGDAQGELAAQREQIARKYRYNAREFPLGWEPERAKRILGREAQEQLKGAPNLFDRPKEHDGTGDDYHVEAH